jgi:hypothetical protein
MDHAAAIDCWLHSDLARRYRAVLHEAVPAELLAIVAEADDGAALRRSEQAVDAPVIAQPDRVGGRRAG